MVTRSPVIAVGEERVTYPTHERRLIATAPEGYSAIAPAMEVHPA